MERISTKIEYRLQIGKQVFWRTIRRLLRKQTAVATFIENVNGLLVKDQKVHPKPLEQILF